VPYELLRVLLKRTLYALFARQYGLLPSLLVAQPKFKKKKRRITEYAPASTQQLVQPGYVFVFLSSSYFDVCTLILSVSLSLYFLFLHSILTLLSYSLCFSVPIFPIRFAPFPYISPPILCACTTASIDTIFANAPLCENTRASPILACRCFRRVLYCPIVLLSYCRPLFDACHRW